MNVFRSSGDRAEAERGRPRGVIEIVGHVNTIEHAGIDVMPVMVMSGHGTISTAVEATKKGAFDFIEKPFESERVLVSSRNALDRAACATRTARCKRAVEVRHQIVGDSAG